jgi:hypothetical protein
MKCESSSTITFSCILVFYLTTTLTSVTPEVGVKKIEHKDKILRLWNVFSKKV